jgi:hypothetical protein
VPAVHPIGKEQRIVMLTAVAQIIAVIASFATHSIAVDVVALIVILAGIAIQLHLRRRI